MNGLKFKLAAWLLKGAGGREFCVGGAMLKITVDGDNVIAVGTSEGGFYDMSFWLTKGEARAELKTREPKGHTISFCVKSGEDRNEEA